MTGVLVSVLLPSRHRTALLAESVTALLSLADDPARIEILVAADPDDSETQGFTHPGVRVVTVPQRWGRGYLERYYNHLAPLASGAWLMIWNDDAHMRTQGWDTVIGAQEPGVLALQCPNCWPGLFPVFPAAWAAAMGCVAGRVAADCWLNLVGQNLGRFWEIPVEVFHDQYDLTGNNDDLTYREGAAHLAACDGAPRDGPSEDEAARRIRALPGWDQIRSPDRDKRLQLHPGLTWTIDPPDRR